MKNQPFHLFGLSSVLAVLIALMIVACSKKEEDDQPAEEINQYISALPSWETFSPAKADLDEYLEPSLDVNCEDLTVTTITPASITRTPEEIVTYDPNSEILYVGSLIQGQGYIGGLGSIKALPIYQRAPLTISISFQMADNSRVIQNPNLASVKSAIGELVETAQNAGHVSGSSIFYNESNSYSVGQTALSLGLSAKFMKASAQAQLEWEHTVEKRTVSAYFVQKMFTVSMVLPQRPGDLFSSEFTKEVLDEQVSLDRIGPDNLPVYVSNVVYGRMMTLTMTSSYSETEMKAALYGSYNGIGGSVSAEHLAILQNSEIQVVTIGGDAELALSLIRSGQLGEFFTNDSPLTTAVPISYTLRNLGDNEIAKVSETVSYDMVQNAPIHVQLYTNQDKWRSDLKSNGMSDTVWLTNKSNIYKADESGKFQAGGSDQTFMYSHITFSEAATGFPFSFYLENTAVANDYRALVLNDDAHSYGFTTTTISIGNYNNSSGPQFDNDDFEIGVTGNKVYAIGFMMISNTDAADESLASIGENDCYLGKDYSLPTIENGFVGVLSPIPLSRIKFDESADDDDLGIQDFYFGFKSE